METIYTALEVRIRDLLAARRRQIWLKEHAGAIEDANKFLEKRGLWSDGKRQF
jgi:post-segregation antitoxin (ccd killing protein)